jgi:hypothetical protein
MFKPKQNTTTQPEPQPTISHPHVLALLSINQNLGLARLKLPAYIPQMLNGKYPKRSLFLSYPFSKTRYDARINECGNGGKVGLQRDGSFVEEFRE